MTFDMQKAKEICVHLARSEPTKDDVFPQMHYNWEELYRAKQNYYYNQLAKLVKGDLWKKFEDDIPRIRAAYLKEARDQYDKWPDCKEFRRQAEEMLPAALDEIDLQSASLDAAEALIRKNAERMNEMQKEIDRLQTIIDTPLEEDDWINDYHRLQSSETMRDIYDVAKKWHAAYRKAQNSNLIRKQWCEQKDEYISEQANKIDSWIARYQEQAKRIEEQSSGIKKLKENLSDCWQVHDEQAKRIAELEILHEVARKDVVRVANKFGAKIDKQRAALKKLGQAKRARGKALICERITKLIEEEGSSDRCFDDDCPCPDYEHFGKCIGCELEKRQPASNCARRSCYDGI